MGSVMQISRGYFSIERATDLYSGCSAPVFQSQRSHCLRRHESVCGACGLMECIGRAYIRTICFAPMAYESAGERE